MIEKGSDVIFRQVRGGKYDGAWGELVSSELVDGEQRITVTLEDGRQVTFVETAATTSDQEFPRERGS